MRTEIILTIAVDGKPFAMGKKVYESSETHRYAKEEMDELMDNLGDMVTEGKLAKVTIAKPLKKEIEPEEKIEPEEEPEQKKEPADEIIPISEEEEDDEMPKMKKIENRSKPVSVLKKKLKSKPKRK